jgi:hypothetical protein
MNVLHSYRRDYSHRQNEQDGAKSENERHEAQANLTKIAEDLDQCSEEPKANLPRKASPDASNSYILTLCNLCCTIIYCAFMFRRWLKP